MGRHLVLPVLAIAAATAWTMQGGGSLQNAHYALVRAFADGTAAVDHALGEVGEVATNDVARVDGRTYSNKPPGLAFVTVPAFLAFDAIGVRDNTRMLWALGLFGVVLPAAALALLVGIVGERLAGGGGAVAAASLGVGTLLLPYSTLFVHHALGAFLAFAAFALLFAERRAGERLPLVAWAGVVAGAAIVAEYSGALVAGILTCYVALSRRRLPRLAAWVAGVAVGAAPLAVYNLIAFGSPFRTSYSVGASGADSELFGLPSLDVALELLASSHGLLVITPVLGAAAFGVALLYRRGTRAEAAVLTSVPVAYVVFNAAFYSPFGGFSAGPRYLIAAGAFLAVGLAPAWRRAPLATGVLAGVSAGAMLLLTATHPQAGSDWNVFGRLRAGEVPLTAASLVGITGWYAIVPLFVFGALALGSAIVVSRMRPVGLLDALAAAGALVAWGLGALAAPGTGRPGDYSAYLPATLVLAVVVAAIVLRTRLRRSARHGPERQAERQRERVEPA